MLNSVKIAHINIQLTIDCLYYFLFTSSPALLEWEIRSVCVYIPPYQMYSLGATHSLYISSTQTHYHTSVKPFLCFHIATILHFCSSAVDIKHQIAWWNRIPASINNSTTIFMFNVLYWCPLHVRKSGFNQLCFCHNNDWWTCIYCFKKLWEAPCIATKKKDYYTCHKSKGLHNN